MKKLITTSLLAALALTFAISSAEAGRRGKGHPDKGDRMARVIEQLELTAEQQAAIGALRDETREETKPIVTQLRALRQQQRALWQAAEIDEDKLIKLQKKITRLQGQLAVSRIELRVDMLELLTPEQRAELKELRAERGKHGGKDRAGKQGVDKRHDRKRAARPNRGRAGRAQRPAPIDATR